MAKKDGLVTLEAFALQAAKTDNIGALWGGCAMIGAQLLEWAKVSTNESYDEDELKVAKLQLDVAASQLKLLESIARNVERAASKAPKTNGNLKKYTVD